MDRSPDAVLIGLTRRSRLAINRTENYNSHPLKYTNNLTAVYSLFREAYRHHRAGGPEGLLRAAWTKAAESVRRRAFGAPLVDDVSHRLSTRELRRCMDAETDLDAVFDTIYRRYQGYGLYRTIGPQQDETEHRQFVERVAAFDPTTVVEVGTAQGGTLYPWVRHVEPERAVSVDRGYLGRRPSFYSTFTERSDTKLTLLDADSQRAETAARVRELGGGAVDFLFIDADHRYQGVKRDYELYSPLVRDGGLIAFHDILGDNEVCGVGRLWQELSAEHETEVIVNEAAHGGDGTTVDGDAMGGVGLIWV